MFSQTAEYALRAMVCLVQGGPDPQPTAQIAAQTQVPQDYLAKVLQSLTRNGLVKARRGLYGGYALDRPAAEISILDVLEAVDPIKRITSCPLGLEAHGTKLCSLHRKLDDALAHMELIFRDATLDRMAGSDSGSSRALCDVSGGPDQPGGHLKS